MKLIVTIVMVFVSTSMVFSQDLFSKVKDAAATSGAAGTLANAPAADPPTPSGATAKGLPSMGSLGDVKSAIMNKLSPALLLTEAQKPGVENEIAEFLKSKANILPLSKTDKPGYKSKLSALHTGTFGKLKTLLTSTQYSKLMKLKPKAASASNPLSALFN